MKFAANLSYLFTEQPFLERFSAAAEAGFKIVECHWPYDDPVDEILQAMEAAKLSMCLINTPPGNLAKGEAGLAAVQGREDEFMAGFDLALKTATALNVPMIHIMSGKVDLADEAGAHLRLIANLKKVAPIAAKAGKTLLIEPINRRDMPGYALSSLDVVSEILSAVGADNLNILFDFYHIQNIHGDLLKQFERHLDQIVHVQIASLPARHEPELGEVAYDDILPEIKTMGYSGIISAEYRPRGKTEDGLGWLKRWKKAGLGS